MKILSLGDYAEFTGFGRVYQGIFENLPSDWDITHIGSSFNLHHEIGHIPDNIEVYDALGGQNKDWTGRQKLIKMMRGDIEFDLVFLLQDSFILSEKLNFLDKEAPFIQAVYEMAHQQDAKVVTYTPIDQPRPYVEDWLDPLLKYSDELVYYLDWARKTANKYSDLDHKQAKAIHHGVNRKDFKPLDKLQKDQLREKFGIDKDKFLILWGGSNQRRKAIPRDVLEGFIKLHQQVGDKVKLALKTQPHKGTDEQGGGWNLAGKYKKKDGKEICVKKGIIEQVMEDYQITTDNLQFIGDPNGYLPIEKINQIINIADCVYVPSCEGWGLWVTEAMCTKTPTIVGDHSALSEIGDYGRSLKVKVNDELGNRVWYTDDREVYRTQVNLDSFVAQVKNLMEMDENEKNKMVEKAYDSAYTKDWEEISKKWQELFERVVEDD